MPLYKVQFQFKLWNSSDVEPHSVITKHMHIDIAQFFILFTLYVLSTLILRRGRMQDLK